MCLIIKLISAKTYCLHVSRRKLTMFFFTYWSSCTFYLLKKAHVSMIGILFSRGSCCEPGLCHPNSKQVIFFAYGHSTSNSWHRWACVLRWITQRERMVPTMPSVLGSNFGPVPSSKSPTNPYLLLLDVFNLTWVLQFLLNIFFRWEILFCHWSEVQHLRRLRFFSGVTAVPAPALNPSILLENTVIEDFFNN